MALRFRARKTVRLGPVRLHFSQSGFTGWGLKIGKHSLDTPGPGSVQWAGK